MYVRELASDELDFVARLCLDGVSSRWRQVMEPYMAARREWLKNMMLKGLGVSVALRHWRGRWFPKGLAEYVPIRFAVEPVEGGKSLFLNCIWVVVPFWRRGLGGALLKRAIAKARAYGGLSVLAYEGDKWFGFFPYMPVAFFREFGFREVDREGSRVLLYLNLGSDEAPRLIRPKCRTTEKSDALVVDVFFNSQCPWSGLMVEEIKRNIGKYGVVVNMINTDDRKAVEKYGMSRGVCTNGVPVIERMASWKEIEVAIKAQKH